MCDMGYERQLQGKIVAPTNPNAWQQCQLGGWLIFSEVRNLIMDGSGEIDGQGSSWWTTAAVNDSQLTCFAIFAYNLN